MKKLLTVKNKVGKKAWLQGYSKNTARVYRNGFDLFIQFMNETEEGEWNDQRLLEEREQDVAKRTYAFEHKITEFHTWLKTSDPNLSDNSRKAYLIAIRSFFAYHRLDVKLTRQQKVKVGKKARPKRKYYEFTLDDIKRMASVSKPKERFILLVGKELGLRAVDFANLKQGTFIAHLNEDVPVSLGEVYTIKEGVNAMPFLGYDGQQATKQWLQVLKSKGEYDPEKPILNVGEKELTEILKRLTKRAGINVAGQNIRFHQLRVFLITRLSKLLETNRWKLVVGKSVPESSYVKPFELKEDYEKVLPLITVNTIHSLPQNVELQKLKQRIIDLELRTEKSVEMYTFLKQKLETTTQSIESMGKKTEKFWKEIEKEIEKLNKVIRLGKVYRVEE